MTRMQEECGCRIHIERSLPEVRIFGEDDGVQIAIRLLATLEEQVAEASVPVPEVAKLSPTLLQRLAHRRQVTLRVEPSRVLVLGLTERLDDTVNEVCRYLEDPQGYELCDWQASTSGSRDELAVLQDDTASVSSADKGAVIWSTGTSPREAPQSRPGQRSAPVERRGAPAQGYGAHGESPSSKCPAVCPTCGCGRFCAHCGTPVWRVLPMDMAAFAAQAWGASSATPSVRSGETPTTPDENAWASGCPTDGGHDLAMMPMMQVCLVPAVMRSYDGEVAGQTAYMMPMCDRSGYFQPVFPQSSPM